MCFSKWANEPKEWQPLWEEGIICHDGDSNKHLTNIKQYYGQDHFNVAMGGSTTKSIIDRIPAVKARNPVKYSLQVGGNNWILMLDSIEGYIADMRYIIDSYLEILSPENITICNLPYVDPKLEHPYLHCNVNDLFAVVNIHLYGLCQEKSVNYCDIFNALKYIFKYKYWLDEIHYASYARSVVALLEKQVMGC